MKSLPFGKGILLGIAFLLFPFFSSVIYAQTEPTPVYQSLSLSPSTGTIYGDRTGIAVVVNSGEDEYFALNVKLTITGPVEYIDKSVTGSSTCPGPEVTSLDGGVYEIVCINVPSSTGSTFSGPLFTLYFRATAAGESVFTFTFVDPEITTVTGGRYNLVTDATPGGTTGTTPKTGLFDDTRSIIIGGGILVFLGLFFNQLGGFGFSLFNTLGKGAESIKVGVVSGIEKSKSRNEERRISKRRGKLEKEF